MWTKKQKINYLLYRLFGAKLPVSRRSRFAKKIRYHFAKRICKMGKNVNVERNAYFTPELIIGDNSGLGVNCEVYGPVTIGNGVLMGPDVMILTGGHAFDRVDIPIGAQGMIQEKAVIIDDDCWIGARVIILPGVHIGTGCVIGAGAVVTKDIPSYSVVGGCPARLIRSRK